MRSCRFVVSVSLLSMVAFFSWGADQVRAQVSPADYVVDPATGYYVPDYYWTPNWANSPPLMKFIDPLPGLYVSGVSPLQLRGRSTYRGSPDKITYPDLITMNRAGTVHPADAFGPGKSTRLRGYRQTNTTDPVVSQFHYLGPVIIATKGTPVRIKFTTTCRR